MLKTLILRNTREVDPTRTVTLRKAFEAAITKRLNALRRDITRLIVTEDAFGLKGVRNVFCPTGEGGGIDPTCSPGGTHAGFEQHKTTEATVKLAHGRVAVEYDNSFTSDSAAERIVEWLKQIPQRELDKSTARRIVFFEDTGALMEHLTEQGIEADPDQEIKGAFDFETKTLYASTWDGYEDSPRTLLHEIGHSILGPDEGQAEAWAQIYLRDFPVENVFCPTGEGGGIDPTCSPGGLPASEKFASLQEGSGDGIIQDKNGNSWQVIHTVRMNAEGEHKHIYEIQVPDTPRGVTAGGAETGWDKARIMSVGIHSEYQRRGLATALYDHIEKHLGTPLEENWATTPDGKAFWESRRQARNVANAGRWEGEPADRQLQSFEAWMMRQANLRIIGATQEQIKENFWNQYIEQGWRQGARRSFDDVAGIPSSEFGMGERDQFLRQIWSQPVTREKVEFLASRVFTEFKGFSSSMSFQISRRLADGLVQGLTPAELAASLHEVVGVSAKRAMIIVRQEITRAHAEGQLDAMEAMGVEELGVNAEIRTAGDERVCPVCHDLAGPEDDPHLYTIDEARGMIPVHIGCRCSWAASEREIQNYRRNRIANFKKPRLSKSYIKNAEEEMALSDDVKDLASEVRNLLAVITPLVQNNCGTGAGGFQPGNTCAKGGGVTSQILEEFITKTDLPSAAKAYAQTLSGGSITVKASQYYIAKGEEGLREYIDSKGGPLFSKDELPLRQSMGQADSRGVATEFMSSVAAAKVLVDEIRSAPLETQDLYRAVVASPGVAHYESLKPGDDFSLDRITSFSSSRSDAAFYGQKGETNYEIRIRGLVQSVATDEYTGMGHAERITLGNFRVVDVTKGDRVRLPEAYVGRTTYSKTIWIEQVTSTETANVFCPTGPGGGVDPTCSPSGRTTKMTTEEADALMKDVIHELQVSEKDRCTYGACVWVSGRVADELIKRGYDDFKAYDAYVFVSDDDGEEEEVAHSWLEFKGGRTFDPTAAQFGDKNVFYPDEEWFAEKGDGTNFVGSGKEFISYLKEEMDMDMTSNVFCPTGEGGGIDPTCSPGGGGGGVTPENLESKLDGLRERIAAAAQEEYDAWEQDEEGIDEECGAGGICDLVSGKISDVVLRELDVEVHDGGQDGDDHAFPIFRLGDKAYGVDIPPNVYETGGGYSWKKIPDVQITADDVEIFEVDASEFDDE